MVGRLLLFVCVFFSVPAFSQKMQVRGHVQDTAAKEPLAGAVAMAVKLSDSTLVQYTRTNKNGIFHLKNIPLDTYQVIISHPRFSDQVFIVVGSEKNLEYDFGKIILPLKSQQLNEVVVYAFKDPIYYRGDTLVYTADSFKVKPNATVEDLLKRLPGIKVDASGKITTQGKTVDQVLVDGDEFFGSDPTVATRNLNANAIESVQVYDKKSEANASSTSDNETIKVMNLKLKEDAKKGYFGKASGAGGSSDLKFTKQFYEGEFLANKFDNKRKVSLFMLAGNTPKTNLGFGDIYRYGLTNDMNSVNTDDGTMYFMGSNSPQGIPQTLKGGAYYTDKIGKNTKLLFNYTYASSKLATSSTTRNQYFLPDTSYTTSNESFTNQQGQSHIFNFTLEQNLDSLTKLTIKPKITVGASSNAHTERNQFITQNDTLTRQTDISNNSKGSSYEVENKMKFRRDFKKTDRVLKIDYDFNLDHSEGNGILKTTNTYFTPNSIPLSDVNQQKTNNSSGVGHDASLSYTEPLTKKIKLEFMLDFINNKSNQDKQTLKFSNGDYTVKDSTLSNNFENVRTTYRSGLKLIYETKKLRIAGGSRVRDVLVNNYNMVTSQFIHQDVTNVLPFFSWRYKFSDNKNLSFNYFTGSTLPSITQLQPVPNNSNPNYITKGNPNLLPSYQHHFELNYNSYKPLSGKASYGGMNFNVNNNDFSNSTIYDNIGRTITQPINVNGNMSGDGWFGLSLPFFSKVLSVDPTLSGDYYSNTNYVNGLKNVTTNLSGSGDLRIAVNKDKFNGSVTANYQYTVPKSTLSSLSNKPYATQSYEAELSWDLPKKWSVSTDAEYVINTKRTAGYNVSYVLWNMTLNKKFLANENLILGLSGKDLLNQNISATRTVQGNVITDNKTNIIKRYVMLQLTWKFNSQKKKDENEWGD